MSVFTWDILELFRLLHLVQSDLALRPGDFMEMTHSWSPGSSLKQAPASFLGGCYFRFWGPGWVGGVGPSPKPRNLGLSLGRGQGAPAVCSLNGLYKPCPPTGRRLLSDSSKGIFTRQSLWLKTFLSPLLLF